MNLSSTIEQDPQLTLVGVDPAKGERLRVKSTATLLLREVPAQGEEGTVDSELLLGEEFTGYLRQGAYVYGQCSRDDYVGYIYAGHLQPNDYEPTHRVCVIGAPVYGAAGDRMGLTYSFGLNSQVHVVMREGDFAQLRCGLWVFADHLMAIGHYNEDWVGTGMECIGAPYGWGRCNTAVSLDCSGLVQMLLLSAGIRALRDASQMERQADLGHLFHHGDKRYERGDLLFWKGHVGIATGPETVLHANGRTKDVAEEPLALLLDLRGQPTCARRVYQL